MDKVLLVARYSGDDDAGALDRQRELLAAWLTEDPGRTPAVGPGNGWVVDETVSGSVNLDARPSLGQWMRQPLLAEWDTMVVTMQDRVTRDDLHWWVFVGRLIEWGKRLVVLDDPGLDLATPNGRMIAGIKATQAANYRQDVKDKLTRAKASYKAAGRYVGGHWPFGYRAVPRDGAEGWERVVDPVTSEYVREAVRRIIEDGASDSEIIRDWIRRGVQTAREHQAANTPAKPGVKPRKPKAYTWHRGTLRKILTNPALLGYAVHNGEVIRDDGIPLQVAEPIITPDEAMKLQEIFAERGKYNRGIRANRSPLLGVVYCACGRMMTRAGGSRRTGSGRYEYYRCGALSDLQKKACPIDAKSWPADMVHSYVQDFFLLELGEQEYKRRIFIPGTNRSPEIASLNDAIEHLTGNLGELPAGSRAAKAAIDKVAKYEKRLDELESEPVTPAKETYKPTGETFGSLWDKMETWADKGAFLMRAGIRCIFAGTPQVPDVNLQWPDNLLERASHAVSVDAE